MLDGINKLHANQERMDAKLDAVKENADKNFKGLWDQYNNHIDDHKEAQAAEIKAKEEEVRTIKKNPPINWMPIVAVSSVLVSAGVIVGFGRKIAEAMRVFIP